MENLEHGTWIAIICFGMAFFVYQSDRKENVNRYTAGLSLVVGCFILAFTAYGGDKYEDRFDAFEKFSSLGEQASCSEIFSTTSEVEISTYNPIDGFIITYNVVDYLQKTGNSFTHCEAELKPIVTKECLRVAAKRNVELRENRRGNWEGYSGYEQLCKSQLSEMYSSFQDDYELISAGFLTLYKGLDVIALRPANIEGITFEEVVSNKLWSAEIQIKGRGTERLLFGDKGKWNSAIENLTKL